MSYEISVPTPFNDVSELAESFHSRVDEERLMLPSGESVPEGEWVQFTVILADGSAALQGQGRCTGSFDNGEDRAPEHRFDVVMDSLQLDEMAQVFFERILQVRAAHAGEEPPTGEVEVPEHAAAEQAAAEQAAAEQAAAEQAAAEQAAAEQAAVEHAEAAAAQAALAHAEDETAVVGEQPGAEEPVEAEPAAEAVGAAPVDEAYAEQPAAEDPAAHADAYAQPEQAVEPQAYAEPVAEAQPAEGYVDASADMQPAGGYVDASADVQPAEDFTPSEADAYAEPASEGAYDEAQAAVEGVDAFDGGLEAADTGAIAYDEVVAQATAAEADIPIDADALPSEELDSGLIEEAEPIEVDSAQGAPPSLAVPSESRIYELPAPQAPGPLPSPHSQEAVLTRRVLHATWSPQPRERDDQSLSSGMFAYAQGAGLPQPSEPPRPELDPSLRVAPAPQPSDEYVGPGASASPEQAAGGELAEAQYDGAQYDGAQYDGAQYDEAQYDGAQYDDVEQPQVDEAQYGEAPQGEVEQAQYDEGQYEQAPHDQGGGDEGYAEASFEDAGGTEDAAAGEVAPEMSVGDEVGDQQTAYEEAAYTEDAEGGYEGYDAGADHGHAPDNGEAYPHDEQAAEGAEYADQGYDDMQTMDANTRQVDVSALPDDVQLEGTETLQVEIPEEEPG